MDSTEIGFVFLIVLLSGIPGSKIAACLAARHWNPIQNIILCNMLFIVSTCIAALVLTGPEDKQWTFLFGMFWGFGLGWIHPMHISAYISLIEKGQEAEMMGIYLLLGQILSWLPPLAFTMIIEFGLPMAFGLGSLSVFFTIATLSLLAMGKYEDAVNRLRMVSRQESVELKGSHAQLT